MSLPRYHLVLVALILFLNGCVFGEEEHFAPPPDDGRPWILVDLYHTTIQNPEDYRLHRDQYNYQGSYGFHRLFEHLETNDYPWRSLRTERLSAPRLDGFSILFINLVHDTRNHPEFSPEEIELIIDFVETGGSLFVISDHTNVYRHAERINPFLKPMGIEVMYHTTVDRAPEYSVSGGGWLMSFDFADHPVTEDVEMISFKTGGPLKTEHGVAFSSERSYADFWDESHDAGFYGDWRQGDNQELEPSGPLTIVAAAEFGRGRVAVVGDQNIFGDGWLHFGDNFELATNIFEWLAFQEDSPAPLRAQPLKGHHIAMEGRTSHYQPARVAQKGYYNFFIESNRNEEITMEIQTTLDLAPLKSFMIPAADINYTSILDHLNHIYFEEDELDEIEAFLRNGGQVILSFEADDIPIQTIQVLERLAPDLEIRTDNNIWTLEDTALPDPRRLLGPRELRSSVLPVHDLTLGALSSFPQPGEDGAAPRYPEDYEDLALTLLDVDVPWGEPFLEARRDDGSWATIARHQKVGDGELIIFVQDGFWRNRTLGSDELLAPRASFRQNSIELQHRFLDYLRESHPSSPP